MFAVILAEMIRKLNKYVTLDMLIFNVLSCAIEKCLKFGFMQKNMKHSNNFFRKVAAPTGQNSFKKISLFKFKLFSNQFCVSVLMKSIMFTQIILYFGQNLCIQNKYIIILSMASILIELLLAGNVLISCLDYI